MELMLILNLLKLSVTKASSYKILTSYVCTGLAQRSSLVYFSAAFCHLPYQELHNHN